MAAEDPPGRCARTLREDLTRRVGDQPALWGLAGKRQPLCLSEALLGARGGARVAGAPEPQRVLEAREQLAQRDKFDELGDGEAVCCLGSAVERRRLYV